MSDHSSSEDELDLSDTEINTEKIANYKIENEITSEKAPDDIKPVIISLSSPAPSPSPAVKKKPGRPKKQITKKAVPKLGIVSEPSNLRTAKDPRLINIFELLYDNPIMFKKIYALFKSMSVENIRLKFDKSVIKMYATDHTNSSQIYIKIFGDRMNSYYTSKILEFSLGSRSIQKILQTLNKDCAKIYWFTNVQYERSKIKIGLSNDEMEEDSIYTIDLDQPEDYDWDIENELLLEEDYPLKFELPFRYFKKKVTDFKLLGEIMKIEKHGPGLLRLSYNFSDKKGDQNTYFKNPAKINLRSFIEPDQIFSTSVFLDYLKPLAGSLIADNIHISACVDKKIIFTALLDQDEKANKEKIVGTEKCEIKVLTKTVGMKAKE